MVFESEEALRTAMYGEDKELAKQVTEAVLRDNIEFGVKSEEPEQEEIAEAPELSPVEDVVEPEKDLSVVLEEQNSKLKELYENQVKEREDTYKQQLAEQAEKIRIFEEQQKAKKEERVDPMVSFDEEDPDLASTYSRNTRKLVEAELEAIKAKVSNPELEAEIAQLKQRFIDEENKNKKLEDERRAEESRRALYTQLDTFSKGKPQYELPVAVSTAVEEINVIKDRISEVCKTDDVSEIEKIYRRVLKEDTVWSRAKKAELDKAGVVIPEYAKNYLNIVEVYELQRGKKFNTIAGVYEDAVISLDDAYKLSNFSSLVTKAGSTEAREIQKKLDQHQNAAVTLSNAITSDAGGVSDFTEAEVMSAIRMNPADLIKNKTLARKYVSYLKHEGMSVPSILKNL
jgi:hypothetical protein